MKKNPFEGKTVFKAASTFDQGWSPDWQKDTLPCRDETINSLTALYRPVLNEGGNLNINSLIIGKGGIGKTITSRYFGKMFRDAAIKADLNMLAEYIDCNEHSTKNSILREVLSKLKISTGRGYSDPELMKQLVSHLKNNNRYLFLILDEVHKLEHDDLLSFLNASITFGSHNVRMSFLCITRASDWLRFSTERLTSRIQKNYTMKPYNAKESFEILKFRCRLAFYPETFTDEELQMIAVVAEKEKNMRVGIEIIRRVALRLDEEGLDHASSEMIREAGGNTISNYDTNLLNYLSNEHEYMVLLSVARFFKNNDQTYITTIQINEQYEVVCEEYKINALKFATLKRYIKKIEDFGLLSKSFALPEGKERGRESRYNLNEYSAGKLEEQLTKILNDLYK
ncbi:MAG: AAA family ATPase [archaeon]|nr:AAA family ATPase [archaeon]